MAVSHPNLRQEQPHLWQRVLTLAITFMVIGFPLLFAPSQQTPNANVSILQNLLPLNYHAWIFMAIGVALLFGSYSYKHNYQIARVSLSVALGYSIMWLLSLIYGVLTGNITGLSIVSLWAFFTYIIFNTLKDPGFIISDLIREVRRHHNV